MFYRIRIENMLHLPFNYYKNVYCEMMKYFSQNANKFVAVCCIYDNLIIGDIDERKTYCHCYRREFPH